MAKHLGAIRSSARRLYLHPFHRNGILFAFNDRRSGYGFTRSGQRHQCDASPAWTDMVPCAHPIPSRKPGRRRQDMARLGFRIDAAGHVRFHVGVVAFGKRSRQGFRDDRQRVHLASPEQELQWASLSHPPHARYCMGGRPQREDQYRPRQAHGLGEESHRAIPQHGLW